MGAHLLQLSNRFTAYSYFTVYYSICLHYTYAIELNLGRMILDISPHNHLTSDFPISLGDAVGARLLKVSKRITTHSSNSFERKLDRMWLHISPHKLIIMILDSASDLPISPGGALGARLEIFKSIVAYSIYPIDLKLGMIWLDINLHNHYEQYFLGVGKGLRISNYFADIICTSSLVSPSQKFLPPRFEKCVFSALFLFFLPCTRARGKMD